MKDTPMGRADLHCHTYYSDGELSPRAVVEEARRIGLRALAITDHDTMEGLQELTPVPGLEIVPGIERKAYWEGVEIHVLGFDCDWEVLRRNPRVQQDRNDRNRAMIDLLRADGVDVSMEELKKMADGGSKSAARALKICDNFDKALTAILIGNNVVNIASSALATVFFTEKFGSGLISMCSSMYSCPSSGRLACDQPPPYMNEMLSVLP